jgi:hypothetical protein
MNLGKLACCTLNLKFSSEKQFCLCKVSFLIVLLPFELAHTNDAKGFHCDDSVVCTLYPEQGHPPV